jgi:hypothetical protein
MFGARLPKGTSSAVLIIASQHPATLWRFWGGLLFFGQRLCFCVVCTLALLLAKVNRIFSGNFTFGDVGGILAGGEILLGDMHENGNLIWAK